MCFLSRSYRDSTISAWPNFNLHHFWSGFVVQRADADTVRVKIRRRRIRMGSTNNPARMRGMRLISMKDT